MDPNAALDPFAYALEAIPTDDPEGAALIPDRDEYYADPHGHGRVHRRPDAAGRRPHVPLPVDAGAHAGQLAVHVPEERIVFTGDTIFSGARRG